MLCPATKSRWLADSCRDFRISNSGCGDPHLPAARSQLISLVHSFQFEIVSLLFQSRGIMTRLRLPAIGNSICKRIFFKIQRTVLRAAYGFPIGSQSLRRFWLVVRLVQPLPFSRLFRWCSSMIWRKCRSISEGLPYGGSHTNRARLNISCRVLNE